MTSIITATTPSTSTTASAAPSGGTGDLGQQDFLTLMTTQLRNQDPFQPMKNGEFLAQMAQFSTVSGLDKVNQTLGSIGSQIDAMRLSGASALMGRQVLVPGGTVRAAAGGIRGTADLSQRAASVTVSYTDAATGALLRQQDLGPQPSGLMDWSWTDLPQDMVANRAAVRVDVRAQAADGTDITVNPSVYARVTGVDIPGDGTPFNLQVEDFGVLSSLEITSVRSASGV